MNKSGNVRLNRQDWILAGLKTLAGDGIEAVRVEPLAKALGVTKGSFYWHFKNRDAFLKALLDEWRARATMNVITEVDRRGGDAQARLRALFTIVLSGTGRLDMEIRAWAAKDRHARAALLRVDRTRLDYVEALFEELGFAPEEAKARARFVYQALIGQFAMGAPAGPKDRLSEQFEIIFEMLVRR